jgi:superfamily II DNA helicase RecQ
MVDYCENTTLCRHVQLLNYFEEEKIKKKVALQSVCPDKRCDVCQNPEKLKKSKALALSEVPLFHKKVYVGDES